MGDRANVYLELVAPTGRTKSQGLYLYTHWSGSNWPEKLREALIFGKGRWTDDSYLTRIITSRMFDDLFDSETGGGISLNITDNEYPVIIADLTHRTVSFAEEGDERDPSKRRLGMSFEDYISAPAEWPDDY